MAWFDCLGAAGAEGASGFYGVDKEPICIAVGGPYLPKLVEDIQPSLSLIRPM